MENVQSFHTCAYEESDDSKEITIWRRTITLVQALPILAIKLFIVAIALTFDVFNQIFNCFVPKRMNDIRGQLAVVSVVTEKCHPSIPFVKGTTKPY